MKTAFIVFSLLFFISGFSISQSVGIGTTTPNISAQLDITNSSKGLLIPRMTTAGINAIPNPAKGLMVYDSIKNQLMVNMGTASSKNWQTIVFNSGWNLTGNSGTNPITHFLGTMDNNPLVFKLNNGYAGKWDLSGNYFIGDSAGIKNTGGYSNVAIGSHALFNNTDGLELVAIGDSALFSNQNDNTGSYGARNAAVGSKALYSNTTGSLNTAMGYHSLYNNSYGGLNLACGDRSLYANTSGTQNVAIGSSSLLDNTTGSQNTAVGANSLAENIQGIYNTAIGMDALLRNSGSLAYYNTGVGYNSLGLTSNSQYNTAVGFNAGGKYDNGYNNVFVGANTDVNAAGYFNVVAIGKGTVVTGSSAALFGNTATGTYGGWASWTTFPSDARFKKDVKENVPGLDFILKLRPVTYHVKVTELSKSLNENGGKEWDTRMKQAIADKEEIVNTGFIAQEVERVARELNYDFSGIDKPKNENGLYGLRYAEFVVPLVKAVQEQQQMIDTMKRKIDVLEEQNKLLRKLLNK